MAINSTRKLRAVLCLTLLLFLLAVQIPAFAAVSGSTSMAEKGDKYVVTASYLNFRSGPGTSYPVVTGLKKGTTV
ncbi:MAG: SH3 domain-containing protein, partial [Clostridia bacterium]|nr:SH3 domain-containing protein [Clostridia bacterium]